MTDFDPDDDALDGALFRFWIRAASYPGGWPSELARELVHCTTPADYRKALVSLAKAKGVNLPPSEVEGLRRSLEDMMKASQHSGQMVGAQFIRAETAERVARALADWITKEAGADLPLCDEDAAALAQFWKEASDG